MNNAKDLFLRNDIFDTFLCFLCIYQSHRSKNGQYPKRRLFFKANTLFWTLRPTAKKLGTNISQFTRKSSQIT